MSMAKKKNSPLQVEIPSLIEQIRFTSGSKGSSQASVVGSVFVLGVDDQAQVQSLIRRHAPRWQSKSLLAQASKEVVHFSGTQGPVWIFCRHPHKGPASHHGRLEDSDYSWHRDQLGTLLGFCKAYQVGRLKLQLISTNDYQDKGVLVGLELSAYSYKNVVEEKGLTEVPEILISKVGPGSKAVDPVVRQQAQTLASAMNLSRHLVNTPPNQLNPTTMSEFIRRSLKESSQLQVDVWNESRLQKEGMGLHLGVGQGSPTPPCLVHIRYRPKKVKNLKSKKPVALVGKGITFDSGGLDIKPSSGMRLMKKDMGGAAALCGVAQWLSEFKPDVAVDIYLALAENNVDGLSMRPSDVLIARNGMSVEIHNTDAEGRLVLADALDVAVTQKGENEPECVIDVATLTGAIKVGLGADISGLFSNDDKLAEALSKAGSDMGEPNWRMPLFSRYGRGMDSAFADVVNATEGFGGAITAALFLEKFVRSKSWAHLDIYGWNERATGPLTFAGGNAQTVQTLVEFLSNRALSFPR